MAEKTKALIFQMRPKFQELRDARTYTEPQVKKILFKFARDLGCDWSDKKLNDFIETVFDFD
jgi:hypothetical protein